MESFSLCLIISLSVQCHNNSTYPASAKSTLTSNRNAVIYIDFYFILGPCSFIESHCFVMANGPESLETEMVSFETRDHKESRGTKFVMLACREGG